ncbi:galectin-1-like isoform X2 [Lissotriton helveticus]
MEVYNMILKLGEWVKITGIIPPDAKQFVINLGKDSSNIVLHFNPRFNYGGFVNTIVYNSQKAGSWGKEQRETAFPFKQGEKTEISIQLDQDHLTTKLPGGQAIKFPNRLGLKAAPYLCMDGFQVESVTME